MKLFALPDGVSEAAVRARFETRITRTEEGCWEWQGPRKYNGYGQLSVGNLHMAIAHRVSFFLANGAFDAALFVCHSCDNPPCVRPDHLFLGTAKDNMEDCLKKGRFPRPAPPKGSASRWARHTEDEIYQMRVRLAAGESAPAVARSVGLSANGVLRLWYGKTWSHVPWPPGAPFRLPHASDRRRFLSEEDEAEACRQVDAGVPSKLVAEAFSVSQKHIKQIRYRARVRKQSTEESRTTCIHHPS